MSQSEMNHSDLEHLPVTRNRTKQPTLTTFTQGMDSSPKPDGSSPMPHPLRHVHILAQSWNALTRKAGDENADKKPLDCVCPAYLLDHKYCRVCQTHSCTKTFCQPAPFRLQFHSFVHHLQPRMCRTISPGHAAFQALDTPFHEPWTAASVARLPCSEIARSLAIELTNLAAS